MPDTVELTDAGTIEVVIDDATYTLRRPKIGELRGFEEGWQRIVKAQDDDKAERAKLDEEALRQIGPASWDAMFIGWYRSVFDALGNETLPPNDDDLPSWMIGAEAGIEWQRGWKRTPWVAGVRPSERQTSAVMNQLADMTRSLTAIERAIPALTSANGTRS